MQVAYSAGINNGVRKKLYHQQELHLTPRDFDILKFVLEMKFASLEDLARKFFWRPQEYPNGPTLFRTRDRLYKLQINKLIVPERWTAPDVCTTYIVSFSSASVSGAGGLYPKELCGLIVL